jgi:hypothetical protein
MRLGIAAAVLAAAITANYVWHSSLPAISPAPP